MSGKRGELPIKKVGEFLTEEQVGEILTKALDDRLAALPESERAGIDREMLEQKLGYR